MAERVMTIMVRASLGEREIERGFINFSLDARGAIIMSLYLKSQYIGEQPLTIPLPQACLFRALKLRDQIHPISGHHGYDSLKINDAVYQRLLSEKS